MRKKKLIEKLRNGDLRMDEVVLHGFDPAKYFFPNGCPYCGHDIELKNTKQIYGKDFGEYGYVCSAFPNCNSYVHAHPDNTKYGKRLHPRGRIASKELRRLQKRVRTLIFYLLKDGYINVIYPDFLVYYKEYVYKHNGFDKNGYSILEDLSDGLIIKAKEEYQNVSNRTKAMVWLSGEVGIPFDEFDIGYLSNEECEKCIDVLLSLHFVTQEEQSEQSEERHIQGEDAVHRKIMDRYKM